VDKCEESGENSGKTAGVLRPDGFADSLSAVSLDELAAMGIRGIIVDLDNTLLGYGMDDIAPQDVAWIEAARSRGFALALVSNNFTERVRRVSERVGVPAVPNALKPLRRGFSRALTMLGTPKAATIVIGDQLFTDVLGAKLVGLRVILTRPIVAHDWHGTRVLRFLERLVLGSRKA
jgi:HAD superfamily phosphatase (TIGR01668 family)